MKFNSDAHKRVEMKFEFNNMKYIGILKEFLCRKSNICLHSLEQEHILINSDSFSKSGHSSEL